MRSAALVLPLLLLGLICPTGRSADEPSARAKPSRPGNTAAVATAAAPLPAKRFGALDYVSLSDGAARLGLKLAWVTRGRKLVISGPGVSAELENDSREATINGLRVFLGDPVLDASGMLFVSRTDFERCLTPLLRPGFAVPPPPAPQLIMLDPGHGGKDNGTSANEKIYALDVARRVRKILGGEGRQVRLTRDGDTYLDLAERADIANAAGADLFVSIHFNAVPRDTKTSGVEVFTFAPRNQHAAEWWSFGRKEDPHFETTDMPGNRFDHWNMVLAQSIHRRFVADLKAFDRGKKLAHWGVLRPLKCPGVLVECGFLTSDVEARKIATPAYRQKLAETIAAGIRDYVTVVSPARARTSAAALGRAPMAVARK